MKTKSIIATLLLIVLSLSSCKSREEKVISDLDNLSERIEKHGSEFDADDWKDALEDFANLHEDMQDCEFTKEQLRELGKKEGKVSAILAKEGAKALGKELNNFLGNFGAFAKGFKEGAESAYDEDEIKDIGNDIINNLKNIGEDYEEDLNP